MGTARDLECIPSAGARPLRCQGSRAEGWWFNSRVQLVLGRDFGTIIYVQQQKENQLSCLN